MNAEWKKEANEKLDAIKAAIETATDPEDIMMLVDDFATFVSETGTGGLEETSSGEED